MAVMHSYLDRRTAVLNNTVVKPRAPTGRERYSVPRVIDSDDFAPIITSLLDPRRRRTDQVESASRAVVSSSASSTSRAVEVEVEARERNQSERARAQALIASKRVSSASITSTAPSENWSGMYNARETRDAKSSWQEKRNIRHERERERRW
jgi:hypothetical protein